MSIGRRPAEMTARADFARRSWPGLQQLRQERPRGHNQRRAGFGEAVRIHVWGVENDVEGEGRLGLVLKVGQGIARLSAGLLDLHQHPGLAVADDHEIHLSFEFVPEIAKLKLAKPEIGPVLDGLEQMAGDEGLRPLAVIGDVVE
jgi:hypothetical protein